MIIADTNVVSEFMKDTPDSSVLDWARTLSPSELSITVVTVEEIERGIGRLPRGRRRQDLAQRWTQLLSAFSEAVATYDVPAARATASILVSAEASGKPVGLADAQIAGICLANDYQLATRNLRDFSSIAALIVVNPFE